MGKRIISIIAVAAIAAVAGWNYQQNMNKVEMSDLALANVEALASGETDDEFYKSTGCYATICDKSCKGHSYASISKCSCSLCN